MNRSYLRNKLYAIRKKRKLEEKNEQDGLAKVKGKLNTNEHRLSKSEEKICEQATD